MGDETSSSCLPYYSQQILKFKLKVHYQINPLDPGIVPRRRRVNSKSRS